MAITPLPRDAEARPNYPGSRSRKWGARDFTTVTSLADAGLTATTSEGSATLTGGELVLSATKATWPGAQAYAYVAAPNIDLSAVRAVRVSAFGIRHPDITGSYEGVHALATWAQIYSGGAGVGMFLHQTTTTRIPYLRHTVGDWPVSGIPEWAMDEGNLKNTAYVDRTLAYIPATSMAYGMEGTDEVRLAREMTSVTDPTVTPLFGVRLSQAGTREIRISGFEVEVFYP